MGRFIRFISISSLSGAASGCRARSHCRRRSLGSTSARSIRPIPRPISRPSWPLPRCGRLRSRGSGARFKDADIAGFHIYGEHTPGGGIDYTAILATVPAYVAGIITDGFGYGGFGQGGFGQSAGSYSWTSQPLSGGTWNWGVKPFDTAGNEGSAQTTAVTITAPPLPPAPFPNMTRLQYTYNSSTNQVTLAWNASPSLVRCQGSGVWGLPQMPHGPRTPELCNGQRTTDNGQMANTYTPNVQLAMPAPGDRTWNVPVNGNAQVLDALAPVGALAVVTTEVPSATLNVQVAAGHYLKQDGTIGTYAGLASQAMTASATNYLYLDLTNSGALVVNTSGFPTTAHVRLATVVAGATTITSITDARVAFHVVGSFVDGVNLTFGTVDRHPDRHGRQPEARLLRQDSGRSADPGRGHRRHELHE